MKDTIVISAGSPRRSFDWQELWRHRELLVVLVRRDIAVRYQEAALGALWAILQPLGMMLVFTLVFGRVAHAESAAPYPLIAFSGLLPWMLFSTAVNASAQSVLGARSLISKVYFPRLIIPLSAIGAPLVDFCLASILMVCLMLYYGQPLRVSLLSLPLVAVLAATVAAGVGSLLASAAVFYRDVRHALPFVLSAWLFLTPVIYPISFIEPRWQWLLSLNPMTGVVEASRAAWLGEPAHASNVGSSVVMALGFLLLGCSYFRSVEQRFADVI